MSFCAHLQIFTHTVLIKFVINKMPCLFVVSQHPPTKWDQIKAKFNDVYFVKGNISKMITFSKLNVEKAFSFVLLASRDDVTTVDEQTVDSKTLFTYLKLEQFISKDVFFSVELTTTSNMAVLNATIMRRARQIAEEAMRIQQALSNLAVPGKAKGPAGGEPSPAATAKAPTSPKVLGVPNVANSAASVAASGALSSSSEGHDPGHGKGPVRNSLAVTHVIFICFNTRALIRIEQPPVEPPKGSRNGRRASAFDSSGRFVRMNSYGAIVFAAELSFFFSCRFLSGRMSTVGHAMPPLTGVVQAQPPPPALSSTATTAAVTTTASQPTDQPAQQQQGTFSAPGARSEMATDDAITAELNVAVSESSDQMWDAMDTHHILPVFSSGKAYVPSSFESLLVQSFYVVLTPVICEKFVVGQLGQTVKQFVVPKRFINRKFLDIFRAYVQHNILCLGIYRAPQKSMGALLPYVYLSPPVRICTTVYFF